MKQFFIQLLSKKSAGATAVPNGRVAADAVRCIQCGVCGYNCPMGIPVRDYARQGLTVSDDRCISCGQCIHVCPRGTLRWEKM